MSNARPKNTSANSSASSSHNKADTKQTPTADGATPMMVQFLAIKHKHPGYLLFYRMGDFYELFFDDALTAAAALDITLTHRGQHQGKDIPMCGVPVHASETYLHRLIRKGFKVAVCEQTEDPAEAKKRGSKSVVKRDVVRLVTAGTLTEDTLLDASRHNYLAALGRTQSNNEQALAWLDMSTGDLQIYAGTAEAVLGQLAGLMPREVLLPPGLELAERTRLEDAAGAATITDLEAGFSHSESGRRALQQAYGVETLDGFGKWTRPMLAAGGMLISYIELTQLGKKPALKTPRLLTASDQMRLDAATRNNLELLKTMSGERQGSLLSTIDRTVTGAGARLLTERLAAPLADIATIRQRHDSVDYFLTKNSTNSSANTGNNTGHLREDIRAALKSCPDMARALARLSLGRGGPRDLAAIRDAVQAGFALADNLAANQAALESDLSAHLPEEIAALLACLRPDHDALKMLADKLASALGAEMPVLARDGGFVAVNYAPALDEARQLRDESRRVIAGLQNKYRETTGIKALKVKHNAVLGYHIEVPAAHGDVLMGEPHQALFIHRQTLANSVRFSTAELAELAGEISRAAERALGLEMDIFETLCADVLAQEKAIAAAAEALAVLDVTTALAELAAGSGSSWVRPEMFEDTRFIITAGRHPVVEQAMADRQEGQFIANDCALAGSADADSPRLTLLTGPNMAGKSTYLRQNALIAILAQMGSFVPAAKAAIGIVDQVFSRVGAADDLARGRSTFMVEMVETAAILNQAGPSSLVILDEIGRGTATFDGLSIAWATVEYLHDVNTCRALFATHYHELTSLADRLPGLRNTTMRVKEYKGEVVFLHEVTSGAADRSYGVHVAELAGLPAPVLARAREVLAELEESRDYASGATDEGSTGGLDRLPLFDAFAASSSPSASNEIEQAKAEQLDELRAQLTSLNPDSLTPREALEALYRLHALAGNIAGNSASESGEKNEQKK